MTPAPMTHEEAVELSGMYALDALSAAEKAAIDAHLASCGEDHSEFETLGGVSEALPAVVDPVEAPPSLKDAVLAAYRADVALKPDAAAPVARALRAQDFVARPVVPSPPRWQAPNWMGWAAAAVAIVLLAVLGAYGWNLRQQVDQANERADQLALAVAALAAPGSQVAILHGSGAAAGVTGFAAFPQDGSGYMVMTDVPAAPSGKTYQAWYIVDGQPSSAGTMAPTAGGNIVASGLTPTPGTSVVAVTIEPTGGSDQPTSDPIIVGNVTTQS